MGKKSQIPKPSQKKQPSRIPEQATQLNRPSSTDDEHPSFRFTYADKIVGFCLTGHHQKSMT